MTSTAQFEQLANLPYVLAMVVLIVILVALQRLQPRIAIGAWLVALSFVLAGQLAGYYMAEGGPYARGHILHICCDLLAGFVFLLYTGRPLRKAIRADWRSMLNAVPFLALGIVYGMDISSPTPFLVCALGGGILCVVVAYKARQHWTTAAAQLAMWAVVATMAEMRNLRGAMYIALGSVYAAAAFQLWRQLREHSLGRLTAVASLAIWSLSFFIHPWIFHSRVFGPMAENIWTLQKFFVTLGMLLVLLEDKARENEHLAHHDELTGLANRRLIRQQLQSAIEGGHVHVILLDLNGFKAVNDTYGHLAGDQLLRIIADRLREIAAPGDRLARLGGDEFVVLTANEPSRLILTALKVLAGPAELATNQTVQVTASIGVARFPADNVHGSPAEIASQLLRLADQRMYSNKVLREPSLVLP